MHWFSLEWKEALFAAIRNFERSGMREEMGFEGEDSDGGEGCDDGDDEADAHEFPEGDFCASRGELQND